MNDLIVKKINMNRKKRPSDEAVTGNLAVTILSDIDAEK